MVKYAVFSIWSRLFIRSKTVKVSNCEFRSIFGTISSVAPWIMNAVLVSSGTRGNPLRRILFPEFSFQIHVRVAGCSCTLRVRDHHLLSKFLLRTWGKYIMGDNSANVHHHPCVDCLRDVIPHEEPLSIAINGQALIQHQNVLRFCWLSRHRHKSDTWTSCVNLRGVQQLLIRKTLWSHTG